MFIWYMNRDIHVISTSTDTQSPVTQNIEEITQETATLQKQCVSSDDVTIYTYMYHYIRDKNWDDPNATFINNAVITENFETQMQKFQELQQDDTIEIILLSELEEFQNIDCYPHKNLVILTSDDGWDDNFTRLYPIAKKYGIKFHLSIISDFTQEPRYYNFITPTELQTISADPLFEIIGHTYRHLDLRGLSEHYLSRELCDSKKDLETLLDISINTIIYPAGKYNQEAIRVSRECGYSYGFTTQAGTNKVQDLIENPYTLRRIRVSRHSTVSGLTWYFE